MLLRLIPEREIWRIGGEGIIQFKGRIISATNTDIPKLIEKGFFRKDLYWRLNTFEIKVPPLSQHLGDTKDLILHFAKKSNKPVKMSVEVIDAISDIIENLVYDSLLEGNVRQLENILERLVKGTQRVTIKDFQDTFPEYNKYVYEYLESVVSAKKLA
jgi:transcriptional regulator with PAS, ATPase and Fis domain